MLISISSPESRAYPTIPQSRPAVYDGLQPMPNDFTLTPVDHVPDFDTSDVAMGVPVDQQRGRLVINPRSEEAASMTHQAPDAAAEDVGRRVRQTGQNLYDTFLGPAERLGRAATSGTLDVTDPSTAGDALGLVGGVAGARMPFAEAGTLGSAGGKPGLADVLPRGAARAITDRPIHPDVLASMQGEQTAAAAPALGGRDIHPDVLAAMRAEQDQPSPLAQSVANSALQQASGDPNRAAEILRGKAQRAGSAQMEDLYNRASGIIPETISSAATKIGNQIYSGKTHGEAFSKAEDELKEKIPRKQWTRLLNTVEEGFLTSHGRYVNREEANAIADSAEQINRKSPYYAEGSLASEATKHNERR